MTDSEILNYGDGERAPNTLHDVQGDTIAVPIREIIAEKGWTAEQALVRVLLYIDATFGEDVRLHHGLIDHLDGLPEID